MDIRVLPSTLQNAHIIKNMYPAYLHDLSQFQDQLPNAHGLFEDESIKQYKEQSFLAVWWEHPKALHPFLIQVDGRPAGFALVAHYPYIAPGSDNDIQEFFLLHPYRHKDIGQQAAIQLFARFRGRWQLEVLPKNEAALHFWRKVLSTYTDNTFTEAHVRDLDGAVLRFRFTSQSTHLQSGTDQENEDSINEPQV